MLAFTGREQPFPVIREWDGRRLLAHQRHSRPSPQRLLSSAAHEILNSHPGRTTDIGVEQHKIHLASLSSPPFRLRRNAGRDAGATVGFFSLCRGRLRPLSVAIGGDRRPSVFCLSPPKTWRQGGLAICLGREHRRTPMAADSRIWRIGPSFTTIGRKSESW